MTIAKILKVPYRQNLVQRKPLCVIKSIIHNIINAKVGVFVTIWDINYFKIFHGTSRAKPRAKLVILNINKILINHDVII